MEDLAFRGLNTLRASLIWQDLGKSVSPNHV